MQRHKKKEDLESMVEQYETALVLSDEHQLYINEKMVKIAEKYLKVKKPKYRVHLGDLFDNPAMSVFDPDPGYHRDTQEEIDAVVEYLHKLHLASPETKTIIIFGNHDYGRLERQRRMNAYGIGSLRALELPKLIKESSIEQEMPIGEVEYHKEWRLANAITFVHGDPRIDPRIKGGMTGARRTAELFPNDDYIIMGHRHRKFVGRDMWKDREVHHIAAMLDPTLAKYAHHSKYENGFCVIHYNPQVRPKPWVHIQNETLQNGRMFIDGTFWSA